MKYLIALATMAALTACDGSVVDVLDEPCTVPRVGATCPYRPIGLVDIDEIINAGAWCADPEGLLIQATYEGDVIEYACLPPAGEPITYRYVVGSYTDQWGMTYQTARGTLIHCDLDGVVRDVYPLVNYGSDDNPVYLRLLSAEDYGCLDDGRCRLVSEQCAL